MTKDRAKALGAGALSGLLLLGVAGTARAQTWTEPYDYYAGEYDADYGDDWFYDMYEFDEDEYEPFYEPYDGRLQLRHGPLRLGGGRALLVTLERRVA